MGECLIVRRGGESYELPVLDASYPKDAAVTASPGGSASFSVHITTPGRPAEYTYQWYKNGAAVSGANAATLTLTALTAVATYSVYCKVTNKAGSVSSRTATLTVRSYLPAYTYTGSHQLIDDGNYNWRLKLLTSGTLTFSHLGSGASAVDAFLVGGGGGGAGSPYGNYGGGGGGGGYTRTEAKTVALTAYSIVIGAGGSAGNNTSNGGAGGTTSAFGVTASGGMGGPGGHNELVRGANGGSGGGCSAGVGGSDGSDGGGNPGGGIGQHTTTREFGEASGTLYAGGGGGAGNKDQLDVVFAGGAGGGANGGGWGNAAAANTGGGGGGVGYMRGSGGAGGSGIVVIRNHR